MDTDELTATFRDAGLSPYEAEAYVALLDLGTASATRVAEESDVPPPRIYDVLRGLEDEGYVELYDQETLRARAHSPTDVMADLQERASRFEAAAAEVEQRWDRPAIESNEVSIVRRFQTVIDHAKQIVDGAEKQVQLAATLEQYRELRPWLEEAHDRGVHVRVAIHTHPDDDQSLPVEEFEGVCTEVRHRTVPSPFLALVDQTQLCFSPNQASYGDYGVLVDDRAHAFIFHWFYLTSLWAMWDEVYSARTDELPITYVDIRQCVRDIEPFLDDGATVHVTVEGTDIASGEPRELSGTVSDVRYAVAEAEEEPSLLRMAGQVLVEVETDDGSYDVGGWAAVLEDVSASEITVEAVEYPDPATEPPA